MLRGSVFATVGLLRVRTDEGFIMRLSDPSRWGKWTWIVLFWTFFGLVQFSVAFLVRFIEGVPFDLTRRLWYLAAWYTWVPTTGLVVWTARRWPPSWRRPYVWLPIHLVGILGASLFSSFLWKSAQGFAALLQGAPFDLMAALREAFVRYLPFDATLYMTMVGAVIAFDYYRRYKEQLVHEAELKRALAEAELRALKMQLHPHFFFNALHTIAMLVRQARNREAVDAIAELGDLFRYVLDNSGTQEVSLRQELAFFESYVEIERIRFKDRVQTHAEVAPDVWEASVPFMLLQPLVENVFKHGMGTSARPVLVEVLAWREGDHLRILLRDDGVGLPPGWTLDADAGIGLANTRDRMERLYGDEQVFQVRRRVRGGTEVDLVLPCRVAAPAPMPEAPPPPALAA